MKILAKLPSRERPERLKQVITEAQSRQQTKDVTYLISLDSNDPQNTLELRNWLKERKCKVVSGASNNKIHACNRDIKKARKWDILILLSDDMVCCYDGWDTELQLRMSGTYPDTDGCLWYTDGYQGRICTLTVMGRAYYDRFGYIYHPDYISLWCDEEYTHLAMAEQKMIKMDYPIFKHEHFVNNPRVFRDSLYDINERFFNIDKLTYERRKTEGLSSN